MARLADGLEGLKSSDFAWSPDVQKIAFSSVRDEDYSNIYVMNADGTELDRLTAGEGHKWPPAWSLDGKKIAFPHQDPTNPKKMDIYLPTATNWSPLQVTS